MKLENRGVYASVLWSACGVVVAPVLCANIGCNPARFVSEEIMAQNLRPEDFYDEERQTRLAIAVDQGNSVAVKAAVQSGADIHAFGRHGYSLLYWALARGRVAGFEALIENGADLTKKHRDSSVGTLSEPSWDIIHLVVAMKDTSFLEAALRHGFDPNHICSPSGKETLLYVAIDRHAYAAIQVLAEAHANMNCEDSAGYSPLAYAMTLRDYRAALLLLENGADPLVGSSEGKDIVTLLKTYGSRGVRPDQEEYFEKVVAELIHRGLITREDIVEADKPKPSVLGGPPGVTVIEHPADSEAGRAIRQLDERERAATGRERK